MESSGISSDRQTTAASIVAVCSINKSNDEVEVSGVTRVGVRGALTDHVALFFLFFQ